MYHNVIAAIEGRSRPRRGQLPAARTRSIGTSGDRRKRRRWESNPLEPGCSRSPGRLAPASSERSIMMSPPGIEPGPRPSQSRVLVRHTPRTIVSVSPARESNPALRLRRPPCARHTRENRSSLHMPSPGIEPGLQPSESCVLIRHTPRAFQAVHPERAEFELRRSDARRVQNVRANRARTSGRRSSCHQAEAWLAQLMASERPTHPQGPQ